MTTYTLSFGVPFAIFALALASSVSTSCLNRSSGCAPESSTPLIRNDGVPFAPIFFASAWSSSIFREARVRRERLVVGLAVDARGDGPQPVILGRELRLVLEREVVELEERASAAEREHHLRGLGGGPGVDVKGQRLVLPHDADVVRPVRRLHLLERGFDARAERALEIRERDDGDRRIALAPHRIAARDGNGRVLVGPCGGGLGCEVRLRMVRA